MGVRKIQPNFRSITGLNGAADQEFESSLEADLMTLQQFDPEVDHFESQPLTISYVDQVGMARTYTPDLLVRYKPDAEKSPLLCEVKYRDEYRKKISELRPKFKAAVHYAKANGMRFRVMTDREIRTPYLANARFLLRFRNIETEPEQSRAVLEAMRQDGKLTPASLLASISQERMVQAAYLPVLWHLMANFVIQADLSETLGMESRIWLAGNGEGHGD